MERFDTPGKAEAQRCPNYCHGIITHNRVKRTVYDDNGKPVAALHTEKLNKLRLNEVVET